MHMWIIVLLIFIILVVSIKWESEKSTNNKNQIENFKSVNELTQNLATSVANGMNISNLTVNGPSEISNLNLSGRIQINGNLTGPKIKGSTSAEKDKMLIEKIQELNKRYFELEAIGLQNGIGITTVSGWGGWRDQERLDKSYNVWNGMNLIGFDKELNTYMSRLAPPKDPFTTTQQYYDGRRHELKKRKYTTGPIIFNKL